MAKKINITAQLNAATTDGILADAGQIFDAKKGKFQEQVNEEFENALEEAITSEDTDMVVESIEEGFVHNALRKTEQILTEAEKEQARENIGAVSKQTFENEAVRVKKQVFTSEQKYQARHNISAITAEEAEKIAQDKIYETSVSSPDKLQAVKELSSWLEENPDNAATMNEKISENYADIQRLYRGTGIDEYSQFSTGMDYTVGDVVLYDGVLFRFKADHVAGEWDYNEVEEWSEKKEREERIAELEQEAVSQLGITRLTAITKVGDKEGFNFLPTNKIRVQVATDVTTSFILYICKKGEDDFNAYNNYQAFQPNNAYSIEFDYDIVGVEVYFTNTTGVGNAEISLNLGLAISVNENEQAVQELRDFASKNNLRIGSFSESFVTSTAKGTSHKIYFGGYIKDFVINTHSDIAETYFMYARYKGGEDFVAINNYFQYEVGKEHHITLNDDFDAIEIYVGKQSVESKFDATLYANMSKDINLLETELGNVSKLVEDNKSQIVSVVNDMKNNETEIGIIKNEFQLVKGENLRTSDSLIRVNFKKGERFRIRFRTTPGAITQVAGLYDGNAEDVYQYSLKTNVFYEFLAKKDEQALSLLVYGNDISSNTPLLVEIYKGVVNDSISVEDKLGIAPTYQYNLIANTVSRLGQVVIPIGAKKGEPFEIMFKGDSITNIAGIYAYNGNEDIGVLMYSAKTNQVYQFSLDYDLPYITLLINADSILNDTTLSVEVKRGWYLDTIDRLKELEWKENQLVSLTIKGYANESILEAKNTYNVALKGGTWLRFVITNTDAITDSLRVNVHYIDGSNEILYFYYNNRNNIILKKDVDKIGFLSYTTQEKDREISIEVDMLYNPENGKYNQPIPSYYFDNNYLPNKVARIKELISESAGNGDIFIFSTDEHWDRNAQNSAIIQRYLFDELNIDKLIDGGDTRQHLASEELVRLRRFFFGGRKFYVTGNHEYLDSYSEQGKYPARYLDNSIAYQFNMFNEMANGNLMRNYYYVDFPLQKLRYIMLNAYQQGDEIDKGNGQYVIQAINGYEDEQLTWLNDVALDLEEGWNCLIFTHSLFHYEDRNGMYILEKGKELGKIILNNPSSDKIIAILQGHTHRDAVVNITDSIVSNTENTGREIPVIVTTSDACYFDDLPNEALTNRKANTIYEQAFDVCVLDRTNRKITAVRIGGLASENFNPVGTLEERVINY